MPGNKQKIMDMWTRVSETRIKINNKPTPRVAKATETAPKRRDRNKCKDCGQFHGANECGKE